MNADIERLTQKLESERAARMAAEDALEERTRQLSVALQELERLSCADALTGLSNRRHFSQAAAREFARAVRHKLQLSAIMLDIDHFRQVNERYGHAAGDAVLVGVAAVCKRNVRSIDVAARYGGEDLCFLLPDTGIEGARTLAERLRQAILSLRFDSGGGQFSVTVSLGVTCRNEADSSIETLLKRADDALYVAKREGRNRAVVAT